MTEVTLVPLAPDDRNQFILDNQEAFNYGALQELGPCPIHRMTFLKKLYGTE
jgi:hypothetical protein